MDESGDVVSTAIPEFLGNSKPAQNEPPAWTWPTGSFPIRIPLTARAFVNRMWRELFGVGISKNWKTWARKAKRPFMRNCSLLAAEFMKPQYQATGAHAWNVKHLLKTIVTSATYKQSSLSTPELDKPIPITACSQGKAVQVGAESVREHRPPDFPVSSSIRLEEPA